MLKAFHREHGRPRLGGSRRRARPRARPAAARLRARDGASLSEYAWRDRGSTIRAMDFETRAIHAGQEPDPTTGAVTTPIYQTSTYAQEAVGVHKGYDYARVANPTRTALEECLASLENAAYGHAFSSGLGATTTIMHLVDPGERVVCVNDVYGGIYRMFSQVYEPKGYGFDYITPDEVSTNLAAHLDERTRIVWVETPTNPLLNIVDIRAAADAAHAAGAILVVDNTFATPYLQQPLELGADIVVHSTTKYLGGHSDVDRRLRRHERPDDLGAAALPAEVARRRPGPVRRLARAPRAEDAGGADAPALRERARGRRVPAGAPARDRRALPGPAVASGARARRAPDARLRRHGLVPARVGAGGGRARRADERLDAGREPRRRREPDRAPVPDDARRRPRPARSPRPGTSCGCRSGSSRRDDLVADLEQALTPAQVRGVTPS